MIIFGLDSSGAAGSAAIVRDGQLLCESFAEEGLTHSETLLVRCDEVFQKSGINPSQVDAYAVTTGPGSFTGLRIGLGLIKGMAFANETPCVPVTTFEGLLYGLKEVHPWVLTVLDARQHRVYCALYAHTESGYEQKTAIAIYPIADLNHLLPTRGAESVYVVGDVAETVCEQLQGSSCCLPEERAVHAKAVAMAGLDAWNKGRSCAVDACNPAYYQLSQAERERLKKENNQ